VLERSTPASTFRYFGTGSHGSVSEGEDELSSTLPLLTACKILGNFDAYRVLDCGEKPDDGNLHVAALLTLLKFIEFLLEVNDPNAKEPDNFSQVIPFAIVCTPKRASWCKIANEEANLAAQQE
jgi:hypothetical protein